MFEIKNEEDMNKLINFLSENRTKYNKRLLSDLNCLKITKGQFEKEGITNCYIMGILQKYFKERYKIRLSSGYIDM